MPNTTIARSGPVGSPRVDASASETDEARTRRRRPRRARTARRPGRCAGRCASSRSFSRTNVPTTTVLVVRPARRRARRTRLRAFRPPRSTSSGPAHAMRPLDHHRDVIAHALDELHHVTGEHDRAAAAGEVLEHRADRAGRHGIDRLERLVEEQQARAVQHAPRRARASCACRGCSRSTSASAASARPSRSRSSPARLAITSVGMLRSRPWNSSSSRPRSRSNSARSSGSTPMRAFAAIGSVHTSMPSTHTCPRSGRSSPVAMRSVVVLPAPLGPTMPKNEPRGTSRLISATAIFGPNALAKPAHRERRPRLARPRERHPGRVRRASGKGPCSGQVFGLDAEVLLVLRERSRHSPRSSSVSANV